MICNRDMHIYAIVAFGLSLSIFVLGARESPVETFTSFELPKLSLLKLAVPKEGNLYHGVHLGDGGGNEDAVINDHGLVSSYLDAVGQKSVAWIYFSQEWSRSREFPAEVASFIRGNGSVPFIRLMLRTTTETSHGVQKPERVFTVSAIANGEFDQDFEKWGNSARTFGTPILAEWGTEVNGAWFRWNGKYNGRTPAEGTDLFKKAIIGRKACGQVFAMFRRTPRADTGDQSEVYSN